MRISNSLKLFLIWFFPSTLACFIALGWASGSYVDGEYLPMGHDTFYHAKRILDAIPHLSNYYQFDPEIHAPEGSWITWPWFYDWFLALITIVVQWIFGVEKPMAVLVYIPVLWVYINSALLLAVGSVLRLSGFARLILLIAYALSPLTLGLHGFGLFDHHFMEQTCVLLVLLTGLMWFRDFEKQNHAIYFGLSLGFSNAIHNGLFLLLVPVVAAFLLQWFCRELPRKQTLWYFVGAYFASIILVLIPSEPFRQGFFEYYTLSWFHFYAFFATVSVVLYLRYFPLSRRNIVYLLLLGLLLASPVITQVVVGITVMTGDLHSLDTMTDSSSIWEMLASPGWGVSRVSQFYSLFIWLLPITLWFIGTKLKAAKTNPAFENFFSVYSLFGILILVQQFRFHQLGSFQLYLPLIYAFDRYWFPQWNLWLKRGSMSVVVIVAFLPGFGLLSAKQPMALDKDHYLLRPLYLELAKLCEQKPGVVLANMNDGHYISYYTKCSVIADNFILTKQHIEKIRLTERLMNLSPEQALKEAPWIDYFFLRVFKADIVHKGFQVSDMRKTLLADPVSVPPLLRLRAEANLRLQVGDEKVALGRIFEVNRDIPDQ